METPPTKEDKEKSAPSSQKGGADKHSNSNKAVAPGGGISPSEEKGKSVGRKKRAAASDVPNPITQDGERPQKKFYRQRAHCNPLAHNDTFEHPVTPSDANWKEHYPDMPDGTCPTILDIGCGFGGLTVALAKLFPDEAVLGMEIRAKVTEYVRLRIAALRKEGCCQNASVMRTNSMKFLPHYFPGGSVRKMFFCFPDPHFKRKNRPRRIVSGRLLSEYAHALRPVAGRLYCVTDVPELHRWHVEQCDAHPLFRRISEAELADDPCVGAMKTETEEGQKVTRNGGEKYYAVYQRIPDRDAEPVHAGNFFATTTSK